jgi:aryl-alcohol dehydrogenase-like predicted oxidoreductase
MQKRKLGNSNLNVSALRFGCMRMSSHPRFTQKAITANQAVVDLLHHIGAQKGATPAQIALAWLLAQKPWIVPIAGSRKLERLKENIGSTAVQLSTDDLSKIKIAMSQITVIGDR